MNRRAYTLVEMLVALGVALLLVFLLYTGLIYYFRAFEREDEILDRSRRTQEILSLLRDDLVRSVGSFSKSDDVPDSIVTAVGFEGNAATFLCQPRHGRNLISAFTTSSTPRPYLSKMYTYQEAREIKAGMLFLVPPACVYHGECPPGPIKLAISPWGASCSAIHVPIPFDQPESHYWLIRRVANRSVTPVVWAFHSKRHGRFPAGTLLRYANGLANIGGEQLAEFYIDIVNEWSYIDPLPPRRPQAFTLFHKFMGFVHVSYGRSRVREGPDPGFSDDTIMVVGP